MHARLCTSTQQYHHKLTRQCVWRPHARSGPDYPGDRHRTRPHHPRLRVDTRLVSVHQPEQHIVILVSFSRWIIVL